MSDSVSEIHAIVRYSLKRYSEKHAKEIVAVSQIEEEYVSKKGNIKYRKFKPQSANADQFNPGVWYKVWSTQDVRNDESKPFWAVIGMLGESREALENLPDKHRVQFQNIEERQSEPDTECDDSCAEISSIEASKRDRKESKINKHRGENNALQDYLETTALLPSGQSRKRKTTDNPSPNIAGAPPQPKPKKPSKKASETGSAVVNKPRSPLPSTSLTQTLKPSETVLSNSDTSNPSTSQELSPYENLFTILTGMNDTLKQMQRDMTEMKAKQANTDTQVESLKSKVDALQSTTAASTISTSYTSMDEKVEWMPGHGVMIRRRALETMKGHTDPTEWCRTFLEGVYDPEVIGRMRWRRGAAGTIVIDKKVKDVAKAQYEAWLNTFNMDKIQVNAMVKVLGSEVGDVALRKTGPRGIRRKVQNLSRTDATKELEEYQRKAAAAAAQRQQKGEVITRKRRSLAAEPTDRIARDQQLLRDQQASAGLEQRVDQPAPTAVLPQPSLALPATAPPPTPSGPPAANVVTQLSTPSGPPAPNAFPSTPPSGPAAPHAGTPLSRFGQGALCGGLMPVDRDGQQRQQEFHFGTSAQLADYSQSRPSANAFSFFRSLPGTDDMGIDPTAGCPQALLSTFAV